MKIRIYLFHLMFFFASMSLYSQSETSLINLSNLNQESFGDRVNFFQTLNADSKHGTIYLAEICDWSSCLSPDEYFSISLFGFNEIWMPSTVEEYENRVYYGGRFDDDTGYLSITDYGDRISGFINLGSKLYKIYPVKNRIVALAEVINNETSVCPMESQANIGFLDCDENFTFCQKNLKILFLATPEALEFMEDHDGLTIQEFAERMASGFNEVLDNSGLPNKRIQIVGDATPIEGINDPATHTGFNDLPVAFSQISIVNELRQNYEADLVYLYVKNITNAGGVAMNFGAQFHEGFAVGEFGLDFYGGNNLHHEIGHLFDIRHQSLPTTSGGCNRAYNLLPGAPDTERRVTSVWTGLASNSEYIKQYSNPYVRWQNIPAGVLGERNAARTVDDNFCRIADFYPTLDFMVDYTVTNNGPNNLCPSSYTLVANVQTPGPGEPGQPNYSFVWELGNNPFFDPDNPVNIVSQDNFVVIEDPETSFRPNKYVKLTVISQDGYQLSRVKMLRFCRHYEDPEPHENPTDFREVLVNKSNFQISPNPNKSNNIFRLTDIPKETKSIHVINSVGQVVWLRNDKRKSNRLDDLNEQFINPELRNGVYFIKLLNANNEQIAIKKFVIL